MNQKEKQLNIFLWSSVDISIWHCFHRTSLAFSMFQPTVETADSHMVEREFFVLDGMKSIKEAQTCMPWLNACNAPAWICKVDLCHGFCLTDINVYVCVCTVAMQSSTVSILRDICICLFYVMVNMSTIMLNFFFLTGSWSPSLRLLQGRR